MSAPTTIDLEKAIAIAKMLEGTDWSGLIAKLRSMNGTDQVEGGLIAVDDVLWALGLFIPWAATADEYVKIAEYVVPIAWPMLVALNARMPPPAVPKKGQVLIQGHVFDIPTWSKT